MTDDLRMYRERHRNTEDLRQKQGTGLEVRSGRVRAVALRTAQVSA